MKKCADKDCSQKGKFKIFLGHVYAGKEIFNQYLCDIHIQEKRYEEYLDSTWCWIMIRRYHSILQNIYKANEQLLEDINFSDKKCLIGECEGCKKSQDHGCTQSKEHCWNNTPGNMPEDAIKAFEKVQKSKRRSDKRQWVHKDILLSRY